LSTRILAIFAAVSIWASPALADKAVPFGMAYALLNAPDKPRGSVILIPGGDGVLDVKADGTFSSLGGNQLVRTRKAYAAQGIASLTIDRDVNVGEAIKYMRTVASPVVVVATSRGSLRIAGALRARPDGLVLTASFLEEVKSAVGSPVSMPRTLVVHHQQDGCRHTPPSAVEPFKAWGGSKVTVVWMTGGTNSGDPCQARGYHGFNGLDTSVVATVSTFAVAK
jgi:hypothetical protein